MVFFLVFFLYLTLFIISEFFNSKLALLDIIDINYSNFLVILWVIIIVVNLYFFKKNSSWVDRIVLYTFGVYRLVILNATNSLFLIIKNIKLFFNLIGYNFKNYTLFLDNQIWLPLYRRGGYLSFLNSSRTRWQLSKTNSIFKNK